MKPLLVLVLAPMLGLWSPLRVPAQGTTYLSNLDQPQGPTTSVASDSWRAVGFMTGTNSLGYILNSIQLLMKPASGSPAGFEAMLSTANGGVPGSSLIPLTGPDPATGGIFTYAAPGASLSPSTPYYVVITGSTPVVNGAYNWSIASSFIWSFSDGWYPGGYLASTDGLSWDVSRPNPFQLAVFATAIPEPGVFGLLSLGSLFLAWHRRNAKTV